MADPYVTIDEVRARVNGSLDGVADETIADMISEFEEIAENYCNRAWVRRSASEVGAWDSATGRIIVNHRPVLAVTSLDVDGDTIDVDDLTILTGNVGGIYWGSGRAATTTSAIVYEHGTDETPKVIKRACIEYVNRTLQAEASGTSRDIIAQTFDGGMTRYSTPDKSAGRPTGWLEVDRLLNSVGRTIAVA